MSHLSTIIRRVEQRLSEVFKGDPKKAGRDSLFKQSINNLQEYIESWDDYTKEEREEADILYCKYIQYCK